MKYCTKCGAEIADEAVICPKCGCAVETKRTENSTLKTVIKVFMVLGTILMAFGIIPLIWAIPMTVHYFNCVRDGRPVGIGFKVCSLLFVSLIGGILMLIDND